MDDFSWGNTRVVTGESGQKVVVSDEGKFDPASIPKKRWEEYQAEMWEQHTTRDDRSEISGYTYATRKPFGGSVAGSEYGGMPPSRPMSHLDVPRYGNSSRMSLAQSGYGMDSMEMSNLPSDDALLNEIKVILAHSDLMTVTKKSVKMELENRYVPQCKHNVTFTNCTPDSASISPSRSSSSVPPSSPYSSAGNCIRESTLDSVTACRCFTSACVATALSCLLPSIRPSSRQRGACITPHLSLF
jgi:chitin synthase